MLSLMLQILVGGAVREIEMLHKLVSKWFLLYSFSFGIWPVPKIQG
jgi:hypothetical protein